MTNEIKPAWCGLPRQDPRVTGPRTFLGEWQSPKGPIAYCSWECREARRRVGWHAKFSLKPDQMVFECTTLATEDLEKERARAKNEIKRLKAKVNRLRGRLSDSRLKSKQDEFLLIAMTATRNECIRQNTEFRLALECTRANLEKFVFEVLDAEAKSREPQEPSKPARHYFNPYIPRNSLE